MKTQTNIFNTYIHLFNHSFHIHYVKITTIYTIEKKKADFYMDLK